MFINFSNHPSCLWSKEQRKAALDMGKEIVDIEFPNVEPAYTEEQVGILAEAYVKQIVDLKPDAVMCQGEFTLCYYVINRLKQRKIKVVAATSERETKEIKVADKVEKKTIFRFVGFREYDAI